MDSFVLIGLAVLGSLVASPILAIRALRKANEGVRAIAEVRSQLAVLTRDVAALRPAAAGTGPGVRPQPFSAPPRDEIPPQPARRAARNGQVPQPAAEPPTAPSRPQPLPPEQRPNPFEALEAALAARWLVWLGALTLALASAFLVKYSIDRGLLGPDVRVALGFVAGLALVAAGEWLRRSPLHRAIASIQPDYVPAALTSAGLFGCFASLYAAYALYALVPAFVAFVGLAAVALAAIMLSLFHGGLVAVIGLCGAFATPALIGAPDPSAWRLFGYLLFIVAACLGVTRYKNWWWLAAATLAGASIWPLLWFSSRSDIADTHVVGVYLLATALLFLAARRRPDAPAGRYAWRDRLTAMAPSDRTALVAIAVIAVLLVMYLAKAHHDAPSLAVLGLFSLLCLATGRGTQILDVVAALAAVAVLVGLAVWPLPASLPAIEPMFRLGTETIGRQPGAPLLPVALVPYLAASTAFAVLFASGGFAALWQALRPSLWAAVSATMPLLILVIAYARIRDFDADLGWAHIALSLAAIATIAAARVAEHRHAHGMATVLGIYAAAAAGAIALGVAMSLRQAWLTIALAVMLPALGWLANRVRVRALRLVAMLLAATVIVRLTLNYNLLDYPLDGSPLTSWVLYGYGIPAIAFFTAARLFREGSRTPLSMLLDAGALVFAVLLVSLEIRLFATGSLDSTAYRLFEAGLHTLVWLATGTALFTIDRYAPLPVAHFGARVLFGMAATQILFGHLLLLNPLITHEPVGTWPVFNLLMLAYAVPAGFALLLARRLAGARPAWATGALAASGLALAFVYVSLEVARIFQGTALTWPPQSDAELYGYSAAWLIIAAGLIALGLRLRQRNLRHAALIVLSIVVIKVFGIDMAGLTGLYRVASFFGLGLSLVGVGYLYQRFMVRDAAAATTAPPSSDSAPPDAPGTPPG
jgi:uncharacterized membrane protein